MPIGGFEGPSGRRVRSVERALSASTLLPTLAFAALGAVTVLLVAQMGISPLGAVVGPSARDGGHAVTTPRMSISIGPPRLHRSAPARDRETTTADAPTGQTGPTTLTLARPAAHTIPPTRGPETTTADGPTGPTVLTFARHVAHTIPSTRSPETTTADAESAAFTAAVTNAADTDAEVTTREVTTAAVGPQGQADTEVMVASKVMYTVLTRAAMAPAPEFEDLKPMKPMKSMKTLKSPNEDTSVKCMKTSHHTKHTEATEATDTAEASKHAKAAKRRC